MQYQFTKELGHGGMGCVYLGHRKGDPTLLAIKMLDKACVGMPEYLEMFRQEVKTMQMLNHPLVVHIMGDTFSDTEGNLYLPMEYIEGETIEQRVNRHGPFTEKEATDLMCQILDAFQYIHDEACTIHRDIKPSNIMLRPDGRICVIDFGIAKDSKIGSTGKTIGRIIGTDGYMSPEQVTGLHIDHRTDIYSLGCLLYYMVTGKHAITPRSNDHETKVAILNESAKRPSEFVPSISTDFDGIVMRAMDKNMTRRFHSAHDFKQALMPAHSTGEEVTVGRNPDCDIVVNNPKISRNHLKITFDRENRQYTLTDTSRNGTAVDGRLLHNASHTFNPYHAGGTHFPEVLMSGFADCRLDWNEVETLLDSEEHVDPVDNSTPIWAIILTLISPVIGIIIALSWRKTRPIAVQTLNIVATVSIVFQALFLFISFS